MIRSVPYLTHKVTNKNFDRSTLKLYRRIEKQFQLSTHSRQYTLRDYEDLVVSL